MRQFLLINLTIDVLYLLMLMVFLVSNTFPLLALTWPHLSLQGGDPVSLVDPDAHFVALFQGVIGLLVVDARVQDHDVLLVVVVQIGHQLGQSGVVAVVIGEVHVLVHVVNVVPLHLAQIRFFISIAPGTN